MLDKFAKLLGIRTDQAEDALHSERAAKHVVSRRSFFGASAALTAGTVFSFAVEAEEKKIEVAVPEAAKMFLAPYGCTSILVSAGWMSVATAGLPMRWPTDEPGKVGF